MRTYDIGSILDKGSFLDMTKYSEMAIWASKNNATIEDRGDYYEVVALPQVNQPSLDEVYSAMVLELIRERYSQDDEYAILRKRLANIDYDNEFLAYNDYCEECKQRAKAELYPIVEEDNKEV